MATMSSVIMHIKISSTEPEHHVIVAWKIFIIIGKYILHRS